MERKGGRKGDAARSDNLSERAASPFLPWQEGSQPKQIGSDEMMLQQLEYLHNNPVKRGYVDDPVHGRYSSARNDAGLPGLVEVVTD
jgi:hypothetical protein